MSRPSDPVDAIRALYFQTSKATILRDLDRAIDLLKSLPDEEARARAAVYMDGLAQMRTEWGVKVPAPAGGRPAARGRMPTMGGAPGPGPFRARRPRR